MNCQKCGYSDVPDGARFCPECGQPIAGAVQPGAQITVRQDVGSVAGGEVSGVDVGQVTGDVTVESTVNQIEATVVRGDYVDRDVITNNILVLGDPHALDEILRRLMAMQGVEGQPLQSLDALAVPEHVSDQIAEVMAAQKEVAARGVPATPQALYRLGKLAAYRRDYDAALDYFRQAAQEDPEYGDAFTRMSAIRAIVWLQQSRATYDIQARDYDAAIGRLADARTASLHTDPLDREALALRGYVAKTLAQVGEARGDLEDRRRYYQEAARFFEHVVQLEPGDANAHNGLGNVAYALGDLDTAIAAYRRAIEIAPGYTAAHHDLALAFEAKMQADPAHADEWRQQALQAWQRTYELAPDDPGFSADAILAIGQRVSVLRHGRG
jgi:tetratricopeptide (TPR) repeat protein